MTFAPYAASTPAPTQATDTVPPKRRTAAASTARLRAIRPIGLLLAALALPLAIAPAAARDPWPAPDWAVADPATAGLDQARLAAAVEGAFVDPASGRARGTRALVVVRGGGIVAERYAAGFSRDSRLPGWSMTKTVTNALVAVLVGEGRLALADPAPVAAWQGPGDPRAGITLDHLLRMSSGLTWSEAYDLTGAFRPGTIRMLFGPGRRDMAAYAAARPPAHPPGTRWYYASGTSLVLSGIVRRTVEAAGEAYHAFPARALFGPLGMTSAVLEADAAGTFVGSSYMYATARDWARLGLLYLRDGEWAGRRVLPPGWVAYTRTPAPAAPHGEYGAHVWLLAGVTARDGGPARPSMPRDAFYAAGRHGQYVAVVPSLDLVAVRLGLPGPGRPFHLGEFLADLAQAAGPAPPAARGRRR